MHPQKTKQPYTRSARKVRTRKKKSAVQEDPRKSPEKNQKNDIKKKEEGKHSDRKEPYTSAKTNTVTQVEEDLSKVP